MLRLEIPNKIGKKSKWLEFISANRSKVGYPTITIDMSDCQFLEPFHIVSLACLLEEYYINGYQIYFVHPKDLKANNYLTDIDFFSQWNNKQPSTHNINSTGVIGLWKTERARIDAYIQLIETHFKSTQLGSKSIQPLSNSLAELLNNVYDHSASAIGAYCLVQYYPKKHELKMAICDFGKGIAVSVNEFYAKQKDPQLVHYDAIKDAFEDKFSTHSTPRNRGFGMATLKSIVNSCAGEIIVAANEGVVVVDGKNSRERVASLPYNFKGTIYDIGFDTSTFENVDEYDSENFEI